MVAFASSRPRGWRHLAAPAEKLHLLRCRSAVRSVGRRMQISLSLSLLWDQIFFSRKSDQIRGSQEDDLHGSNPGRAGSIQSSSSSSIQFAATLIAAGRPAAREEPLGSLCEAASNQFQQVAGRLSVLNVISHIRAHSESLLMIAFWCKMWTRIFKHTKLENQHDFFIFCCSNFISVPFPATTAFNSECFATQFECRHRKHTEAAQ